MDVILRADVEKVGLRGEVVSVARGYARNYLLPRRLAEPATPARVKEIERRDAERARHEARTHEQAQAIAELLGQTVLRFEVQAGPTGTLFGSVTPSDVADELWRTRKVRIDRRKIGLPEPIKRVGRYSIPIEVFADVEAEVKTLVVPPGGELPEEEPETPVGAGDVGPAEEGGADAVAAGDGAAGLSSEAAAAPRGDAGETGADQEAEEQIALAVAHDEDVPPDQIPAPPPDVEERPDDRFDRAVDAAVEREGEQL